MYVCVQVLYIKLSKRYIRTSDLQIFLSQNINTIHKIIYNRPPSKIFYLTLLSRRIIRNNSKAFRPSALSTFNSRTWQ